VLAITRFALGLFTRASESGDAAGASGPVGAVAGDEVGAAGGRASDAAVARCEALLHEALDARFDAQPFRRDALLRDVAAGMMRAVGPELRRYCAAQVGGNEGHGDDCAQRAFVVFWQRLGTFEGRGSLRGFLFGIAHNICRQSRRDGARANVLAAAHADDIRHELHAEQDEGIEAAALRRARALQLQAALERLAPREAFVLRQRLIAQREYADILPDYARAFDRNIRSVEGLRTLFFHAKNRLVAMLEAGDRGDA